MSSAKRDFKLKAIILRKRGLSYSEIEEKIPVSKSSLSLWLRDVPLEEKHKKRLLQKQLDQHKKAWYLINQRRIVRTQQIKKYAALEIGEISKRELWLIGIALYWAEGAKQKEHNTGEQVTFSNSDPQMVKVFLMWVFSCLDLKSEDILYSLYIHENVKPRLDDVLSFWVKIVNIEQGIIKTYFKKHTVNPYRKNQGDKYMGVFRIRLRRSSEINRRIAGWVEGICKQTN